jgi:hypothetical protein
MPSALSSAKDQPLRVLLLLAPPIFILHFLEEGPGFVTWFNAHVARGITEPLFWSVNYTALAITLAVVVLEWLDATAFSATLVVAWSSFLMFANALLHITGSIVDRAYMPGLVTALVLYVPFWMLIIGRVVRSRRLPNAGIVVAAILGALPMMIHGYLIIFRGSRLF